jgi:XTP/dITP diphosphohydrolase
MKIVFASSNAGKIRELETLLKPFHVEIISQEKLNVPDAEETALTFVENALIKARNACEKTGLPAIADDSGLEVDALHGAPGIYSARYAGINSNAKMNIEKLLHELRDVPEEKRSAAFHCVLVFLSHAKDPTPIICHGIWHGTILKSPAGENGFGYDPVFFDKLNSCSAAQLTLDIKNKISHRGKALRCLIEKLSEKFHVSSIS